MHNRGFIRWLEMLTAQLKCNPLYPATWQNDRNITNQRGRGREPESSPSPLVLPEQSRLEGSLVCGLMDPLEEARRLVALLCGYVCVFKSSVEGGSMLLLWNRFKLDRKLKLPKWQSPCVLVPLVHDFFTKLTSKLHVCESARSLSSGEELGRPVNWGHFLAHSESKVLGVGISMYGFGRGHISTRNSFPDYLFEV